MTPPERVFERNTLRKIRCYDRDLKVVGKMVGVSFPRIERQTVEVTCAIF